MSDKRGDFAGPLYFIESFPLLILILIIFGIFFFVIGITQNQNLVIKSAAYQDSAKVITILRTNVQLNDTNLTIAQIISLAETDPQYKTQLTTELQNLLVKIPLPIKGEDLADVKFATPSAAKRSLQDANWNIKIEIDNQEFLHLGESNSLGTKYFSQSTIIPLESKKLAKIELYLNCFSCTEEGLNAIA